MAQLRLIFRFLKYYFRAKTKYNVHSPFVFDFVDSVLEDDRWYYAFSEWEALRHQILKDRTKVRITDLGAGSQMVADQERTLRSLAHYSANKPYSCRLLFRIVGHYHPATLLELGTSLGISTGYQAAAALDSRVITIEGCPNIAKFAAHHFRLMKMENIQQLQGRFEDMLPVALKELKTLDYVFVDGNHRKEPTLRYFESCLACAHEKSVFVFDDIHWSKEMEQAWDAIRQHPEVRLTIDLYFFGVVFFRKDFQVKEHYTLIKWGWKPWSIGLRDFLRPK